MSETNRQAIMAYLRGKLNEATSTFALDPNERNHHETQKLQAALATAHQLRPAEFDALTRGPLNMVPDVILSMATKFAAENGQLATGSGRMGTMPPTREQPALSGTRTMPPKRPDGDRKDAGVLLASAPKPAVPDEAEVKRIENEIAAAADRPKRTYGLTHPMGMRDHEELPAGYVAPKTAEEAIQRMKDDGDADPEGTARMNYPLLFDQKEEIGPYGRGS